MKKKIFVSLLMVSFVPSIALADTCKSPSQLHKEKMEKYRIPDFPSLLEDCGLNGILDAFGGKIFGSIKFPDMGSFCGYTGKDVAGWYGVDVPGEVSGGSSFQLKEVTTGDLLNGRNLFEMSGSKSNEININLD
ncbi:hypothetical protein M6C35_001961 [Vibrio metschnikovii]|nr:hypothetical protein [Vibrio metschnikovii]